PVPEPDTGRHGRHQPADSRPVGVLQLRGLEELTVRNPPDLRAVRGRLLHATEGRHQPLARPDASGRGSRLPPARIMTLKSAVGNRQSEVLPRRQRTRTADDSRSKTGATSVHASMTTRGGFGGVVPPPECSEGKWSWSSV